uniref:DNA alkylation repair protein n=1 Tax=Steinernema glaseri TaxID=37863 RepID=A0A1I7Y2B5_9BILA
MVHKTARNSLLEESKPKLQSAIDRNDRMIEHFPPSTLGAFLTQRAKQDVNGERRLASHLATGLLGDPTRKLRILENVRGAKSCRAMIGQRGEMMTETFQVADD